MGIALYYLRGDYLRWKSGKDQRAEEEGLHWRNMGELGDDFSYA